MTESRTRNAELSIAGMMIYNSGSIMQEMDGPPDTVAMLFNSIRRDRRHRDVTKLLDIERDRRDFGAWHLACPRVAGIHPLDSLVDLRAHEFRLKEQFRSLGGAGEPLAAMVQRIVRHD